jgi:hypothetical protein
MMKLAVNTSTHRRPSLTYRILNRKLPLMKASDTDCARISISSKSEMNSQALNGLRRPYGSRGLHIQRNISLAERTNDYEIVHGHSKNVDCILSTPKILDRHAASDNIRIDEARRSVSLLKFASKQADESDTENETDDETVTSDNSFIRSESKEDSRTYTIKFQCYVRVVEIPNRRSYTSKQRKRMWNDCKSIRANAKRNRIEYDWEGRNWQNAPEEQDFCMLRNGTKGHPAYLP